MDFCINLEILRGTDQQSSEAVLNDKQSLNRSRKNTEGIFAASVRTELQSYSQRFVPETATQPTILNQAVQGANLNVFISSKLAFKPLGPIEVFVLISANPQSFVLPWGAIKKLWSRPRKLLIHL